MKNATKKLLAQKKTKAKNIKRALLGSRKLQRELKRKEQLKEEPEVEESDD